MRSAFLLIFVFSCFTSSLFAQPEKGRFVKASIGYGLSSPYKDVDILGKGFYAQGEFVWAPKIWFSARPYLGVIFAKEEKLVEKPEPFESRIKSNAVMLGGKVRLIAPIRYFAPYFEIGYGMSVGSFETHIYDVQKKRSGVLGHMPVSVGVALGRRNTVDFAFTYYFHNEASQYVGATAVGIIFSLPEEE